MIATFEELKTCVIFLFLKSNKEWKKLFSKNDSIIFDFTIKNKKSNQIYLKLLKNLYILNYLILI